MRIAPAGQTLQQALHPQQLVLSAQSTGREDFSSASSLSEESSLSGEAVSYYRSVIDNEGKTRSHAIGHLMGGIV